MMRLKIKPEFKSSTKTKDITIFNLAVLRAAVERRDFGTYFGSTAALNFWIAKTIGLGLIDGTEIATDLGQKMAQHLNLSTHESGRAYLWRKAEELENEANSFFLGSCHAK